MNEKLSELCRNIFSRVVKTTLDVSRGTFCGYSLNVTFLLIIFGLRLQKNIQVWRKSFIKLVKNETWRPGEHSEKKQLLWKKSICSSWSFLDFQPNLFRSLAKNFQYRCPNCILGVHGKCLSKTIFVEKKTISFFILVSLVINFRITLKKFSIPLSKWNLRVKGNF